MSLPAFASARSKASVMACALVAFLATPAWAQPPSEPVISDDDPPETGETPPDEPAGGTRVSCLEDVSEDGLQRKGVQKRDFLKGGRFEVSALGGYYASDVLSSTYTYGGALAYYPSEDFGIEALVTRHPVQFRLEEPFTAFDLRDRFVAGAAWQGLAALLFSPIHAKFKFTDDSIVHGDVFFLGGGGRTLHDSVQGFTWQAGVGLKLYFGNYVSFRIDVRDLLLPQEVLGVGRVSNNIVVMGGLGLWVL